MQGYDEERMPEEWKTLKKGIVDRARSLMGEIQGLYSMVSRYDTLTRIIEKASDEYLE